MSPALRVKKLWFALAATTMALLLLSVGQAYAAPKVSVDIAVIEASRTGTKVDPRVSALKLHKKLAQYGFTSAKVMDELSAKVDLGSSVSLEFMQKNGKGRMLQVKVLEAAKALVRLQVTVPDIKFSTKTEHKNGGTFMLALPGRQAKRLFLAVNPKL